MHGEAARKIEGIYDTTLEILRRADEESSDPSSVAQDLALQRIEQGRRGKLTA